jgi:peptidoglycan hydrolase CwlO-like protein
MEVGNITLYALITLIISGVLSWIREWRKHRTWSKNGDDLKEIKEDVKMVNGKVEGIDEKVGQTNLKLAEVKTVVTTQAKHCKQTVGRFDKTIADQNKELISLAKNSGGRR